MNWKILAWLGIGGLMFVGLLVKCETAKAAVLVDVNASSTWSSDTNIYADQCYIQSFRPTKSNFAGVSLKGSNIDAAYPQTIKVGITNESGCFAGGNGTTSVTYLTATTSLTQATTTYNIYYFDTPDVSVITGQTYYIRVCNVSAPVSGKRWRWNYGSDILPFDFRTNNNGTACNTTASDQWFMTYYDDSFVDTGHIYYISTSTSSGNTGTSSESIAEFNTKTKTMIALLIILALIAIYDLFRRMNAGLLK